MIHIRVPGEPGNEARQKVYLKKNRLKHICVDEFCFEVRVDQSVVVVLT